MTCAGKLLWAPPPPCRWRQLREEQMRKQQSRLLQIWSRDGEDRGEEQRHTWAPVVAAAAGRAAVGLAAADEGKGEGEELGMGTGGYAAGQSLSLFLLGEGNLFVLYRCRRGHREGSPLMHSWEGAFEAIVGAP
ncbi:hypothetical protein TRIUR3_32106 [Triticum urartu]|uniref:Uncharacterized protein n=1 Tax=Triticum urartu TaxID=4572 RepID=M7YAQ8_TRIUA|nr:hypothetical protein TRIUR3_32106 [Triticum urartu]